MTVENGSEKASGFILKIAVTGALIELEKILFPVGTFLNITFQFPRSSVFTERVRSIKHYDRFFRNPPAKLKAGEARALPKKLCEVHFSGLTEVTKMAISKFLLEQQELLRNRVKSSKTKS